MVKKTKKRKVHSWNQRVNNLSYHDMKHVKLASVAFAFFLVSVWAGLRIWLGEVHWAWFLGLAILFSIKPWTSFWKHKK